MRVKSRILRLWDDAPLGVSVCCIKFVTQVILAQTPFQPVDPSVRQETGPLSALLSL